MISLEKAKYLRKQIFYAKFIPQEISPDQLWEVGVQTAFYLITQAPLLNKWTSFQL